MLIPSACVFATHHVALSREILALVGDFMSARGLQQLHPGSLSQMSISIPEVAAELLMFGANVWPEPNDTLDLPLEALQEMPAAA